MNQDKEKEIRFFQLHARKDGYDVFTETSNIKLIRMCIQLSGLGPEERIVDLGCGSGVFTRLLAQHGFKCLGLDLSYALTTLGKKRCPELALAVGDAEQLPLRSESLDGIFLSGILHHLPDPSACAREVFRVLKPNGVFVAFDPNKKNPFMWLYRVRASPLYSSEGVTENEQPILAKNLSSLFTSVGFHVTTSYLSGISYRYIASSKLRWVLPLYNLLDGLLFRLNPLKPYSPFVLTKGVKTTEVSEHKRLAELSESLR